MRKQGGPTDLRQIAGRWLAMTALLALAACANDPGNNDSGRSVEMLGTWEAIELAEADLNLPLVAPFEIASLRRRVDESAAVEEIYTFRGMEGYLKTSRLSSGIFPESYAKSLSSGMARSGPFIASLSLPPANKIDVRWAPPFLNGKFLDRKSLSRGFTAEGSAQPYYDNCFVARTAYLLVDFAAVKHSSDPVDTVIEVLLCGNLVDHRTLVTMLARVDTVADRDAFREELVKRSFIRNIVIHPQQSDPAASR